MRQPQQGYPEGLNNRKPLINQMKVIPTECFGKEWSATATECKFCSVFLICAAAFDSNGLKVKRDKAAQDFGKPYLDENKFKDINKEELYANLGKLLNANIKVTLKDFVDAIHKRANIFDLNITTRWVYGFLEEYKLAAKDGTIIRGN